MLAGLLPALQAAVRGTALLGQSLSQQRGCVCCQPPPSRSTAWLLGPEAASCSGGIAFHDLYFVACCCFSVTIAPTWCGNGDVGVVVSWLAGSVWWSLQSRIAPRCRPAGRPSDVARGRLESVATRREHPGTRFKVDTHSFSWCRDCGVCRRASRSHQRLPYRSPASS